MVSEIRDKLLTSHRKLSIASIFSSGEIFVVDHDSPLLQKLILFEEHTYSISNKLFYTKKLQ